MKNKRRVVSFSQFSLYKTCPYKFYRCYILKEKVENIYSCFGTCIHISLQKYIRIYFDEDYKKANNFDIENYFIDSFKNEIKNKNITISIEELNEFIDDGRKIIKEFKNPENYLLYFPKHRYELLNIEDNIIEPIINNVNFNGKLDLVLKEKASNNIKIIDIKTSTNGWNKYAKQDTLKIGQLQLYKLIYSKKYSIPLDKINIEFFIIKRKLYDNPKYKYQKRIQIFSPEYSKNELLAILLEFKKFVIECVNKEGNYKTDIKYIKVPGNKQSNCKFCPYFKNNSCDGIAN